MNAIRECDYLIPQKTPEGYTHSYWTFGVLYEGLKQKGISWEDFRKRYVSRGGDGIYAAWSVPYLEPVISDKNFINMNVAVYNDINYQNGLCPVAEDIQPKLMQFKNNYRDLSLAEKQAKILEETIGYYG